MNAILAVLVMLVWVTSSLQVVIRTFIKTFDIAERVGKDDVIVTVVGTLLALAILAVGVLGVVWIVEAFNAQA